MRRINEDAIEQQAIRWLRALGYDHRYGPDIASDGKSPERTGYDQVILADRLRAALATLNPRLSEDEREAVARQFLSPLSPSLVENNLSWRRALTWGVEIEVRRGDQIVGERAVLVDLDNPDRNDWLVVNQLTVKQGGPKRRPDLVVFINGLPIAVIELKNPLDEAATVEKAWQQLQTYKADIPALFETNDLLIASDGYTARLGSLTADWSRFGPWRRIDGHQDIEAELELEVLLRGLFERGRLLRYLRSYCVWEQGQNPVKKIAGYHQFYGVEHAVERAVVAHQGGERRAGVIWHTQGSGKSLSMVFFAGRMLQHKAMSNPTLVVLTDRNDLDDQLYRQFVAAKDLLRETPEQAQSREHLRTLLDRPSGGVIFSTLQKLGTRKGERMPVLCGRDNVVIIADEAHRSHYDTVDGLARNLDDALPKAVRIGFTGTPIEREDRSTPEIFGDYIDTYTVRQSVADGATVPIYYESRLARLDLPEEERPRIDADFQEVTEDEEQDTTLKLSTTWASLEKVVGLKKRLKLIAEDLVKHWEARQETLDGKAMIVCMSRRICVDLYRELVRVRPDWHGADDEQGRLKVVMTGAATDPADYQPHLRNRAGMERLAKRFNDPKDPFQLVIVRDMWLTGFDVPCANTLYLDRPMHGHTLMQAIARVNRVWRGKPGGLIVDYLGVADALREAVRTYTQDREDRPSVPIQEALEALQGCYERVSDLFHGFDWSGYFSSDLAVRLRTIRAAADHALAEGDDGRKRFLDNMAALNKAVALALHLEEARRYRDGVAFFQAVEGTIRKVGTPRKQSPEALDAAIRQIVSRAVVSDRVIDVFEAAGLDKPDITILSEPFLEELQQTPYKNLQIELLRRLLSDNITALERTNVVAARKFSEKLLETIQKYRNRALESAEVILELIDLARAVRDNPKRGAGLGLTDDELAFYDALADHDGVRSVMGDAVLGAIARDLVGAIRSSVTLDWTQKESVRAEMRSRVKRLLRRHGYPPDKAEKALETVIKQAEARCAEWGEQA